MTSSRLRAWGAAAVAAVAVLAGAPPAAAAPHPIQLTHLAFDTGHVDVTAGPVEANLTLILTDSDTGTGTNDIMGWVELRQFAAGEAVGAPLRLRFFQPMPDPGPGVVRTITMDFRVPVPRYGTTPEAAWRVTEVSALDGHNERTFRAAALAPFGAEFGVTQLVETDAPVLDGIRLGPNQSPVVIDTGAGATVDYRVTVTDLPSGFWKGRLVVAGPGGTRITTPFAVASDGRHTTCGTGSLIDDVYDQVECAVDVTLPAGGSGEWAVARVALTDRLGNTVTLPHPAGPRVFVSRT